MLALHDTMDLLAVANGVHCIGHMLSKQVVHVLGRSLDLRQKANLEIDG